MTDRETETDRRLKQELDELMVHFQNRQMGIDDAVVLMAVSSGLYMKQKEPEATARYNKLVELASTMMASGGIRERPKRGRRWWKPN